tara:strand:- start:1504 stop:4320 length:2817 start_codon:yes stop_codon:yes gene_type:complete
MTIQETFNVIGNTTTKTHPGIRGSARIRIKHISVEQATITFSYGDGTQDIMKFSGKDALTFINQAGQQKRINYRPPGNKSGPLKNHHPEWNKPYIIRRLPIPHGLPRLPANSAAPPGYKAIPGSGPCMCRWTHIGLDACGDLCCNASPWTATDPKATGNKLYDRNHFFANTAVRRKLFNGVDFNLDGTLCFETWQNGWFFQTGPGLSSITFSSGNGLGLHEVELTWMAKNLKQNLAREQEMLARLRELQTEIDEKQKTIQQKQAVIRNKQEIITRKNTKIKTLDRQFQEQSDLKKEIQSTNDELRDKQAQLRSQNATALSDLQTHRENIKQENEAFLAQQQETNRVKLEHEQLSKEVSQMEQDLQGKKAERDAAVQQAGVARGKIQTHNSTIFQLEGQITTLSQTITLKKSSISTLQTQYGDKETELTSLNSQIDAKNKILNDIDNNPDMIKIKADIASLESQYSTKSSQLQTLESSIETAEADEESALERFQDIKEDIENERAKLEADITRLESQYSTKSSQLQTLESSIETAEADEDLALQQLEEVKENIKNEKTKLGQQQKLYDEEQGRFTTLEAKVEELEKSTELKQRTVDNIVDKIENIYGSLAVESADDSMSIDEIILNIDQTLKTRKSELTDINSDILLAEEDERQAKKELSEVQEQVRQAKNELQTAQSSLNDVQEKMKDPSLSPKEVESLTQEATDAQSNQQKAIVTLVRVMEEENEQSSNVISSIDNLETEKERRLTLLQESTGDLSLQVSSLKLTLNNKNIDFQRPLELLKNIEKERIKIRSLQIDSFLLQQALENDPQNKNLQNSLQETENEMSQIQERLNTTISTLPTFDTISLQDLQTIKTLAIAEAELEHQIEVNSTFDDNIPTSVFDSDTIRTYLKNGIIIFLVPIILGLVWLVYKWITNRGNENMTNAVNWGDANANASPS